MVSLKHRETLIRGMGKKKKNISGKYNYLFLIKIKGIVDMCHRVLFGTTGTMANLSLTNNIMTVAQGQNHNMVSAD